MASPGRVRRLCPLLAVVALACAESSTDVDPDSPEALIGIWQYTIAGVRQSTLEITERGTYSAIDADLAGRTCATESGTWSAAAGVVTATTQTRDGRSVSEPAEQVSYQRLGGTLTLFRPGDDDEVYSVANSLPGCADYGWMSLAMFADVDGVMTDFSTNAVAVIDLPGSIAGGNLGVAGLHDPQGLGIDDCTTCTLLVLDLFHELGTALTTGVYPIETFGPTGLRVETTYRPDVATGSPIYGSNDSDPATQPWQGQVSVTTLTADVAEGTFAFVVYDGGGSGPPYPQVVVSNGSFRLSFD